MSTADAQQPVHLVEVVAANIRAECAIRGVTQGQLAVAIGTSRTAVVQRWWGRRQWQLEDIERVADFFGMTPADLCMARFPIHPPMAA